MNLSRRFDVWCARRLYRRGWVVLDFPAMTATIVGVVNNVKEAFEAVDWDSVRAATESLPSEDGDA